MDSTHLDTVASIFGCTPSNAKIRMLAMGIGEDCTRCGGTGRYSRNALGSDVCYDCKGALVQLPRTESAWSAAIVDVKAAMTDGRHAAYLHAKDCRAIIKSCADRIFAAWHSAGSDAATNARCALIYDDLTARAFRLKRLQGAELQSATIALAADIEAAELQIASFKVQS